MAQTKVQDQDLRTYLEAGHTQADAARHFSVSEAAVHQRLWLANSQSCRKDARTNSRAVTRVVCSPACCACTLVRRPLPVRRRRHVMSDKIQPQHVARKAILYVRQSSAYQVNHNLESQRLQYAMQDRLQQLGWREIDVVDDDLGRSAAGLVTRAGFERMVAEVCLGNVGAVAAREVSRFARNSREWQHLVEVCRVVDTVLIDLEAVYNRSAALSTLWAEIGRLLHWQRTQCPALCLRTSRARQW